MDLERLAKQAFSSTAEIAVRYPYASSAVGFAACAAIGTRLGKKAGEASSVIRPVHVTFAQGIEANASPANISGTEISTYFGEVRLPNAASGLRFELSKTDPDPNDPASLEKYASLFAQPKVGLAEPTKKAFHDREQPFIWGGGLLLPVMGLTMVKMLSRRQSKKIAKASASVLSGDEELLADPQRKHHLENISNFLNKRDKLRLPRPLTILAAGQIILAGCGGAVYGYSAVKKDLRSDFNERAVEVNLPDRAGFTNGMTISGQNSQLIVSGLRKIYSEINGAEDSWDKINSGVYAKLNKFMRDPKHAELFGPDKIIGLDISGVHCNELYMNTVLESLENTIKPQFTVVAGDIYAHSGAPPLESTCYKDLATTINGPLVTIRGNHDLNAANPTDLGPQNNYSTTLKLKLGDKTVGFPVVGGPDPRAHKPGEAISLKGAALDRAFGEQGAAVANRACEISAQTNTPPLVLVHWKSAGYETALRGCASVIDNAHGEDNVWLPTLDGYRSDDGETVYQQTTTTASGYEGGLGIISRLKRPGSAIIQSFDAISHELVATAAITYGPGANDVNVYLQKLPAAGSIATPRSFVRINSPSLYST